MAQEENISMSKGVHKDHQLSCFTLQASPCKHPPEWLDWSWFVDLARSCGFIPTTKLSPLWEDLIPFCTTDKEQPLYSLFSQGE